MFSDDVNIYLDNCRSTSVPFFSDEQRGKVIDALLHAGPFASPGYEFTISGPENSNKIYSLEVVSIKRDEIHLNWRNLG